MMLMVPALNHGERVELLAKLQKAMPEPAFNGLLTTPSSRRSTDKDYSCRDR